MGFWPILGAIALEVGKKVAEAVFRDDKVTTPAQQMTQPNWDDIVRVCDRVYNGNLEPINAIGNMRKTLYEQDPQVLRMSLKVLESVLEERGIPARNEQEASEFLRDMRQLLRETRDRDVMDGVFELNEAWSRACRNSPRFRGVGDLVELLNQEGYRVLVTRDNRSITNENTDAVCCNSCDCQLPFDQLKHLCQYCNRIFCSSCCSYRAGISPFQGNAAICMCHDCRDKNNSNLSLQRAASDDRQTFPKVHNNVRDSSSGRGAQCVRTAGGMNDDVPINLVVPRHIAENPEGWTISVRCTKSGNATPEDDTAEKEKKENKETKWSFENCKDKLFEKDDWQDNSDWKGVVTKTTMENENKYLSSEREHYAREKEEDSACQLANSDAEREEKDLKLALERSRQTQMEETEMRQALEISRIQHGNQEREFAIYGMSDEEDILLQDIRRGASERKTSKGKKKYTGKVCQECQEDDDEMSLGITKRHLPKTKTSWGKGTVAFEVRSSHHSENQNDRCRSTEHWRKSGQQEHSAICAGDEDEDSEEENAYANKPTFCCKHAEAKSWEEEEALQRAINLSLRELKQVCYNCGKDKCMCEEEDELMKVIELSRKESVDRKVCCNCGEDKCVCKEDELMKAIEFSRKESVDRKVCCNCGKDECICEETDALRRAIELSRKESVNRQGSCSENEDLTDVDDDLSSAIELSKKEFNKNVCSNCGRDECACEETDALERAIELSRRESVNRQGSCSENEDLTEVDDDLSSSIELSKNEYNEKVLPPNSRIRYFAAGKDKCVESTGKLSVEELRQKRLRYLEQKSSEEQLESLAHCSKQDAEFPERKEDLHGEECHISNTTREKIATIEDEDIKRAIELSLQEMLEKKENYNEESEDESDSS